jgi:hypothetical protein
VRRARTFGVIAALAALSACGSPQEVCIRDGTRDLRTVDRLLRESETNLARGFAYETEEITETRWVICDYDERTQADGTVRTVPRYCLDDVTTSVRRPVAIDPADETRKRDALLAKRRDLNRAAAATVEACRAKYPEGA